MSLLGGLIFFIQETYSAYKTTVSGNTSFRIAKFDCSISGFTQTSQDAIIDLNQTGDLVSYSFTIQNNSEVDVQYAIGFSAVPTGVMIQIGDSSGILDKNGGNETVSFSILIGDSDNPPAGDAIHGIIVETSFTQID